MTQPGAPNGRAGNRLVPYFNAEFNNHWHYYYPMSVSIANGTYSDSATILAYETKDLELTLNMEITTWAEGAYTGWDDTPSQIYTAPSYANLWADNITVTIHTVPVPEPSTYLMLGAGLALMGGLVRSKRNA